MAGVYLSYPFCAQKCTYCNFASGVFPKELEPRYVERMEREIRGHEWQYRPDTVYWGGGTPSLMPAEWLRNIHSAIPGRDWAEATMEAAPGSLTRERIEAWREAGINRVSLGVQSFVEGEIRRTGRKHTAAVVAEEIARLRELGIENINVDLIAGLAGQTRESWQESLDWVEKLGPPHVSVYILEVDEDSRLGQELMLGGVRYGALDVPSEERIVEFYKTAVERLKQMGIERYEISNFARPGSESRHNLKYWQLEPYVGFGADAHSFDGRMRWQNVETAKEYVDAAESVVATREEANVAEERFFVGLRLMQGVKPEPEEWERWGEVIGRQIELGMLERAGERVRLTGAGVLMSNEVFQEFVGA
ncbi:MAG: radical SAM family heme chaperone HemW [Bryobacteraceae bacterium]|nr:radical SAM family heme chaperone HemW [Bryobacteraceae bacterium]